MKLKGEISITRMNTFDDEFPIRITITDKLSRVEFLEVRVSLDEFTNAITGLGHRTCEFITRGFDLVGKTVEKKEQNVPAPWNVRGKESEYLAPFEVDGWKARKSDLGNGHRRTKTGYMVVFHRHVETEEKKGDSI